MKKRKLVRRGRKKDEREWERLRVLMLERDREKETDREGDFVSD